MPDLYLKSAFHEINDSIYEKLIFLTCLDMLDWKIVDAVGEKK